MSERLKAVISHLFKIEFERVESYADVENKTCIKVMEMWA